MSRIKKKNDICKECHNSKRMERPEYLPFRSKSATNTLFTRLDFIIQIKGQEA